MATDRRLVSEAPFNPRTYFAHRFRRWFSYNDSLQASDIARTVVAHYLIGSPPKVLGALFKLWLNAWPVHSDHAVASSCCLCSDPMSAASVRHLLECPAVRQVFHQCMLRPPTTLRAFLLLSRAPRSIIRRRAVALYIVHKVLCFVRHHPHNNVQDVIRAYITRYRSIICSRG